MGDTKGVSNVDFKGGRVDADGNRHAASDDTERDAAEIDIAGRCGTADRDIHIGIDQINLIESGPVDGQIVILVGVWNDSLIGHQ